MVDYERSAPGVHIEEITAAGPIAGTGTSTAALIGTVTTPPDGGLGKPVLVTNWTQYAGRFGEYQRDLHLPHAVRGFFENGGSAAYVVPIANADGLKAALEQLTRVPEVAIVCLPGDVDPGRQNDVLAHCEQMRNRFAVLDGARDPDPLKAVDAVKAHRAGLTSTAGFGALYWPWIVIDDPLAPPDRPGQIPLPPSGHVAGIMARSDAQVGVHKAPANEVVRGARDLDFLLNDTEHGALNSQNINAIRRFTGRGLRVWGARTLTDGTPWRFVNVRRLVSFVEDSLLQGLGWAVFQPNNTALWKGLERSITEFLTRVWRSGALFGATAQQAFYVKIDEELNPPAVRNLGQVVIEIGLAVVRPAEHVVVRIGLWDGGSRVSET
jgi:phage tail sheath protein FI